MVYTLPVIMYVCQGLAICLLAFLGFRYRANIYRLRESGPKAAWSRIFVLFLVSAIMTETLTWTQTYIKCLDTSGTLATLLPPTEAHRLCAPWSDVGHPAKRALFTLYLTFELVAVCSFQALVLERYRKVADLFPEWTSRYALPIYTAAYIPIGVAAYALAILEFYTSPSTLISRDATINTISSSFYCIWIVLTGVTDAVLSFLIVTKVRRSRARLASEFAAAAAAGGDSDELSGSCITGTTTRNPHAAQNIRLLRHLQVFFCVIVLFDCSILSLTAVKKSDGRGIHGHVFAYEVASIEIACTLLHCTLTLCFMQLLGVLLRPTRPQFEFVIASESGGTSSLDDGDGTWQAPFYIASQIGTDGKGVAEGVGPSWHMDFSGKGAAGSGGHAIGGGEGGGRAAKSLSSIAPDAIVVVTQEEIPASPSWSAHETADLGDIRVVLDHHHHHHHHHHHRAAAAVEMCIDPLQHSGMSRLH